MRVALIAIDNREQNRTYDENMPRFGTGVDSMIEGAANIPGLELHVISCAQQPMRSPEKLAKNIWFHGLTVPKLGWMRTLYQGCIRATRRKLQEIQPDVVQGEGTERNCAISAAFSGFPNVVAIAGNMAELARLNRPKPGSYSWMAARLENFTLPRTDGVICNSRYTETLVQARAKRTWVIYPGLRGVFLQPPAGIGKRDRALVIAGVISPRKRQLELLEVAEALHLRGLSVEFRFVGPARKEEAYAKAFLEKARSLEKTGCARYLGTPTHEGMVNIFDAASGMVHFPTEEAFGSVVAEGFARNLKFFGARTGGIREIAEGMPEAELFDTADFAGLTEAIGQWILKGYPCANGSAEIVKNRYAPERYVHTHLEVYDRLLKTKSGN